MISMTEESVEGVKKTVLDPSKQLDLEVKVDDVTEQLASHGED